MDKPKAIIMAGGAAVGKSTVLNQIQSSLKGFENLNAEDDIQEMKEKEFKTLKPNAVPPKTETFKKTVVTPSGDIFDAI